MPDKDTSLEGADRAVFADVIRSQPEIVETLDELLLVLQNGTAECTGQAHDRSLNFVTGLLLVRAFNSLWRARQDLFHGYPIQSLSMARAVFEDWVSILWIEAEPDDRLPLFLAYLVEEVDHPVDGKGRQRWVPSTSVMLNDLGETLERGGRSHYDLLSKFAHPHGASLAWQFALRGDAIDVRAGAYFDERDFRTAAFFLLDIAASLVGPLMRLQERWFGRAVEAWLVRAARAQKRGYDVSNGILDEIESRMREEDESVTTDPA